MDPSSDSSSFDTEAFAQLAEELQQAGDSVRTAEHVIATAVEVLDADHASITMIRRSHRLETIAATDLLVEQLDQLQFELREGPCFDASWRSEMLLVPNLATDDRWPDWAPKAASNGVGSMIAVELGTPARRLGALNLYYNQPRGFSRDDLAFSDIFGRHASLAVANEQTRSELTVALDSRKLIGQAQGILMERHHLSDVQAFEVLKRYSTNSNVRLRLVAEHVVTTRNLPKPQDQST